MTTFDHQIMENETIITDRWEWTDTNGNVYDTVTTNVLARDEEGNIRDDAHQALEEKGWKWGDDVMVANYISEDGFLMLCETCEDQSQDDEEFLAAEEAERDAFAQHEAAELDKPDPLFVEMAKQYEAGTLLDFLGLEEKYN